MSKNNKLINYPHTYEGEVIYLNSYKKYTLWKKNMHRYQHLMTNERKLDDMEDYPT